MLILIVIKDDKIGKWKTSLLFTKNGWEALEITKNRGLTVLVDTL